MSEKLKTIAEVNRPVELAVHEFDDGELHLRLGDTVLATADKSYLNASWLVQVSDEDDFDGFYVTDRDEALDALSDIGILYKMVQEGTL